MLKHNGWTVVDGKPAKVWWDDEGVSYFMKGGECISFEDIPDMHGSRRAARESIRGSKPRGINMDLTMRAIATKLRIDADPYGTLVSRVLEAVDDLNDRHHRLDVMFGEKVEKLQTSEWLLHDSKAQVQDLNERLMKSISLTDHDEQVKQLTLKLHQANMTVHALELKAEALHCHQVMLAAQRGQLRKEVAALRGK